VTKLGEEKVQWRPPRPQILGGEATAATDFFDFLYMAIVIDLE